jgi:transcriptional regulator of nitric oxide reductase
VLLAATLDAQKDVGEYASPAIILRSSSSTNALKEPSLKKLAVCVSVLCGGAIMATAAQRIPTNAAEPYLKQLFPKAVAFSPFGGNPLHYKAYGTDPRGNPSAPPIGFVFWTTDLVPREQGYHGAIHILVGMDLSGVLTGAIVNWDSEPYGYFSVEPPEFGAQFKGKSIRDPFRVGGDVDAVSRASITIGSATRAIRDSSRMMAKLLLSPAAVK